MSFKEDIEYLKGLTLDLTGEAFSGEEFIRGYIDNLVSYFTGIIFSLPNNIYWLDKNCNLMGGNDNLARQMHLNSGAELKGLSYEEMAKKAHLPTKILESFRITEQEIMRTGIPSINKEEPPIKLEGKTFYYLSNKTPLRNKNGDIIGVIGVSTDITQLKETQLHLDAALKKVAAVSRVKSEFMQNMAHDIRTPLSGVIGVAQLQAMGLVKNLEEVKEYGQMIYESGNQLLELLNKVLETIDTDHMADPVKAEPLDLGGLARELHALFQPNLIAKPLEFYLELGEQLPIVLSDRIKLKRVLINLLSNAIKFTKQGTITFSIKCLGVENNQATIEMTVADTGIGITPDKLDQIFDRFYRVHPSYLAEYSGYGIGLYAVKQTLELLKGQIKATSESGKGTQFTLQFVFPLPQSVKQTSEVLYGSQDQSTSTDSSVATQTVLIAEDNRIVNAVITSFLTDAGYTVISTLDGEAALARLKSQSFDWALLDIGLPGLKGTEVCQQYREWEKAMHKPHLPIFALTGHSMSEIEKECIEIGMDIVFTKPLTQEILKEIEEFVDAKVF